MTVINKYLAQYGEPDVNTFAKAPNLTKRYRHLIVIPVYDEPQQFLQDALGALDTDDSVLVILVVNVPATDTGEAVDDAAKMRTLQLFESMHRAFPLIWQNQDHSFSLLVFSPKIDLLIVDRCTDGRLIPRRQGVGLARKVGCDIGLWLIQQGQANTSWIHSTDADARLPGNYLSTFPSSTDSALLYPYRHRCDNINTELAMALYELSLHYYVAGLRWAGSPYGFHTLGSVLAVNAQHYAQVRGFPKRSAGEDFYLLNKLNKIAPVRQLEDPMIELAGRISTRVPFGTGPALKRIMEQQTPLHQFFYYHPQVFLLLKQWLAILPNLWQKREQLSSANDQYLFIQQLNTANRQPILHELLIRGLKALDTQQAVQKALAHSRNESAFLRHMHTWFDGFRTLKLIHYLRDNGLPSGLFEGSVTQAPFISGATLTPGSSDWQHSSITRLIEKIRGYSIN